MAEKALTPNVKKLVIRKMAQDAIPAGGGLGDGIRFLTTPGALGKSWVEAAFWAERAFQQVREAAEPNPWKTASDEEIAGELLRKAEERDRWQK